MLRVLVLVIVCVLALGAGLLLGRGGLTPTVTVPEGVAIYDSPRLTGEFSLVDKNGQPFTPEDLKGTWTLVYFGFTLCPDVCPTSLATLQRVEDELLKNEDTRNIRYMMVSVDPERDTPERIKQYVEHFSPEFLGVTGDPAAIAEFIARFYVAAVKVEDAAMPGGYTVDHTSIFAMVNPDGNVAGIVSHPHTVDMVSTGIVAAMKSRH